jgi:DNA polymerase-3 subunit alpha
MNYTIFHAHSDYSILDSATKYERYIDYASELSMTAFGISEHGNFFNWIKKKKYCDSKNIKYIHGQEFYITETIENKVRDNWHCILIAKNYNGVKELNKLSSLAHQKDGHFYYDSRITIDELVAASNNIIVSSACLGGILNSGNENVSNKFLDFFINNKDRCFLEIQHHCDRNQEQANYNERLFELSKQYSLTLWAGTDTHSLNKETAEVRSILQKSKNINYSNEEDWDLTFKTYDELVQLYDKQNAIPKRIYLEAIENTNRLNELVENFDFDLTYKYPKIYENSEEVFRNKLNEGLAKKGLENNKEYRKRVEYEIKAIAKNGAIDYLLLQEKITSWCHLNNIFPGPSRGSVSGSICAYLLGITEVDSIKYKLNFERFMNAERVSLSDIDLDYPPDKREVVKDYIFNELGLNCSDIVAFNTVATKGAIRDVGRAFEIPLPEINEICKNIETDYSDYEKKYPKLFKYAKLLEGIITSAGIHPCGVVTSTLDIKEELGLFTTSTDTHPISQVDMKDIDSINFVKLDILGLDNIQIINETCELAGIERLNPDNVDFCDKKIWNDILNNSIGVFQWESNFAFSVYRRLFSEETLQKISERIGEIDYLALLSMANGAIRPAGESYRDRMCNGEFNDNGHPALNELLKDTMGFLCYQEEIIEFLNKFCGFSMGKADLVRRGFAKKVGTEKFIPQIKSGFIKTMNEKYDLSTEESKRIIESFLKVIEDASSYLFSLNHSYPYSMIGYICAYLRYYYKLEFLTAMLNINRSNIEKSAEIIEYAKQCKIKIMPPKFRFSKSSYFFDKSTNSIYRDISSIKFVNEECGEQLFNIGKLEFKSFIDLLVYIEENLKINSRQIETLIKIKFFDEFGGNQKLLNIYHEFLNSKNKYTKKLKETTKLKRLDELKIFEYNCKNENLNIIEQIMFEEEVMGDIQTTYNINKRYVYIKKLIIKYAEDGNRIAPRIEIYCFNNSARSSLKIQNKTYDNNPFNAGEIIYINKFKKKNAVRYENGKYPEIEGEYTWWVDSYSIISPEEFDKIVQ